MKTIIVPTDFSPSAFNAANYAVDLAYAIDAQILVFHTYLYPIPFGEFVVVYDPANLQAEAEAAMRLFEEKLRINKRHDVAVTSEIKMGDFFDELNNLCKLVEPYAVVMGSQGSTASERFFFGGHTVHTMKHLKWPVITVPLGAKFGSIKNIGIACDLHDVVQTVPTDQISLLIKDFNAQLHIINTGPEDVYDPEIVFQSGLLQEMLDDIKPEYHFITDLDTNKAIVKYAEEHKIDLLIVIPRRHDLLDRIMHKSHTKHMVLHCPVPVMALHS